MKYLTLTDSIEETNLSIRCLNALRRAGVHTVADLLAYDREKICGIRNLGVKSFNEIYTFLDLLTSGSGDYRLYSDGTKGVAQEGKENTEEEPCALFRDANGLLKKDIPLEELGLSVKSYNCLKNAGYDFASQLIEITEDMLISIKNLGGNSAIEILEKVKALSFLEVQTGSSPVGENASCKTFVSEITNIIAIHGGKLYQKLLPIFERAEEEGVAVDPKEIFSLIYIRDAVKQKILDFVSGSVVGVSHDEMEVSFPESIIERDIMAEIISEMESDGQIIVGSKIERRRMTILEYAQNIPKEKEREFFLKRLRGLTLEEIGNSLGITRERVRQIIAKVLKSKPTILVEDKYIDVYRKYDFSPKDFSLAFGEDETVYNYLTMVCDKRGTLLVEQLLADESFTAEVRRDAERVVYKNYITIGGERIYKSRTEIADYVVRTYFRDEASFDDFTVYYDMILDDLGLSDDARLMLNARTYENKFGEYTKVLWKRGRRFRYYDIESYDYFEFWQELSLDQYHDVEYSARKFFRDHSELMHRYDIRDEYELHNLLKKLCKKNETTDITFGRMPMIEFGCASRDEQVLDMLMQLAPVTIQDFAAAYENEYGVQPSSFMGDFLKNFNEYFHNGIYDISAPPLSSGQLARMSAVLTEDYYEMSDVKRIYGREFPDEAAENINPYTLKTLSFNVFASYIIKNTYGSATEYFRTLLTKDDLVDSRDFPLGSTGKISYNSELNVLKDKYEIVEYEPFRYINIRRLNSAGITVGHIKAYCDAVAEFVDKSIYFTITSLNKSGFYHALEDLGFSEVFYSSLLSEDANRFSYQRMGGTKVFRKGTKEASLKGFLESIIERQITIDIYDLMELLVGQYAINIERYKIVETVKNSSMYYDSIMETVYIDYDTYFEEV